MIGIQGFVPQGYSADKEIQRNRDIQPEIKSKVIDEEEDDPLDAFMLDIDNQVQKESLNKFQQEKVYIFTFFFY